MEYTVIDGVVEVIVKDNGTRDKQKIKELAEIKKAQKERF